jgi:RND family efflux transporter MFP subunit
LGEGQTFVGTLTPRRRSVVGSAVDGRMIDFMVNEGDWVTKGQPLAQLLTGTVEIEIAGAKAELALREQELAEMKNGSLPEEIAQAEAMVRQTYAVMQFTQEKQKRQQRLFDQGNSTSRESLEESNSASAAAEQAHISAKAAYKLAVDGPRKEKIAQAQARRDTAAEHVNLLEDRLEKYTIKAPFDGYVVDEFSENGAWINRGDQIAEVIEVDPIEVTVSVPEHYVDGLQQMMAAAVANNDSPPADVRISALSKEPFSGKVVSIVPQADLRSRSFPVKVHVANPLAASGHVLKAGMLSKVTLPVGTPHPTTMVPKDALVISGGGHTVYVVDTDPASKMSAARPVNVEVGLSQGSLIQVRGELKAGQQVVTRGNERLRPGQPVQVMTDSAAAATASR